LIQEIRSWDRLFIFVIVAALFTNFALGANRAVYNNFISEELGIQAQELGFIEAVREFPGLLTVVLALLALCFSEVALISLCGVLMALGLALYSRAAGFTHLMLATITLSSGFHLLFPVQSALVLQTAGPREKGRRLGQLNSAMALATVMSTAFVYLFNRHLHYRGIYLVAAGAALGGALVMLRAPRAGGVQVRKGFVLKWDYRAYYILHLFSGARRHIFWTFGTFALVTVFGTPVGTISLLLLVGNIISIYTRPLIGRLVDSMGEKKALLLNYASSTLLCLGFACVKWVPGLYFLYVFDFVLVGFQIALTTYLDKIAAGGDVPASLATGSTINHIAGVLVPILGGQLWHMMGYWSTFTAGGVLTAFCLLYAARLTVPSLDAGKGARPAECTEDRGKLFSSGRG